jgi:hypothetical protein
MKLAEGKNQFIISFKVIIHHHDVKKDDNPSRVTVLLTSVFGFVISIS